MADAHDSGSCGKPCRFKSCHPHQITEVGRKNAFDLLFFTSTARSCSGSRAKYSQRQRGRSPTGAVGSARADAHDSGSCGKPCRFKSCHPHQVTEVGRRNAFDLLFLHLRRGRVRAVGRNTRNGSEGVRRQGQSARHVQTRMIQVHVGNHAGSSLVIRTKCDGL